MVAICPKCKEVWGCLDKFGKSVYLCDGCKLESICEKDREEFSFPLTCPDCEVDENQLEFDFPED